MSDATAAEIVDLALRPKPELIVHRGSLPDTAEAVRDLLAASGQLFDRGLPVRVVRPADGGPPSAIPLTRHNVVIETHRLCQPMKQESGGRLVPVTLPERVAQYVSRYVRRMGPAAARWHQHRAAAVGERERTHGGRLRSRNGTVVSLCPHSKSAATNHLAPMPMRNCGDCAKPSARFLLPMRRDAGTPRSELRWSTSARRLAGTRAPFFVDLQTAVCRPSLPLAPGALYTAPEVSGAGSGKGLLVRATSHDCVWYLPSRIYDWQRPP